ncbi:hypothetical protein TKK_0012521 [Trichogramma kaykai]|uniref:MYND-type domain-containing protein n=1 Tax=Trichogramma kaykai TaxID=54128 RepID=A0ABD2WMR8_9HYME
MDAERKAINDNLSRGDIKDFALSSDKEYQIKSAKESIEARKKGNDIYIKKKHTDYDHRMILNYYNKSIAYAPNESEELMYAYSNRAYLLMHINKYNEAIDNLDKALQLTNSTKMKLKLYCQKVKCLAALGSSRKDDVLKEIDEIFHTSKISVEDATFIPIIIEKTKSEVASIKRYEPKNPKLLQEKEERNKIINDKEKVPFEFVEIKPTENIGRGLYAKTDFKTGDIVLVEKPCLTQPDFANGHVLCCHCLAVAWTGIPCETCHEYIFCSLKCKSMAWDEYHHTECSITPYIIQRNSEILKWTHMSLKFIISLVKENKSIDELKSKLKISKNNKIEIVIDKPGQKSELFNKLMRLSYKLPDNKYVGGWGDIHSNCAASTYTVETLILLLKYSSFFSGNLRTMQYNKYSKNENFIFIGSLLLRLVKMNAINGHNISDTTPSAQKNYYAKGRGLCTGLISSMINHSCSPNIRKCFSDEMKFVYYAVEPITSRTQLLDSYDACFYETPKSMRRMQIYTTFDCHCIACEGKWPPYLVHGMSEFITAYLQENDPKFWSLEKSYLDKIKPLKAKMSDRAFYLRKDSIQTVTNLMNEILIPQPSIARSNLLHVVNHALQTYHGLTEPFENC